MTINRQSISGALIPEGVDPQRVDTLGQSVNILIGQAGVNREEGVHALLSVLYAFADSNPTARLEVAEQLTKYASFIRSLGTGSIRGRANLRLMEGE